jgi:hypothetical protein
MLYVVCVLQMATAPEAIEFFMALFCNTTRIVLLMETVPWKLLVQVQYAAEAWGSRANTSCMHQRTHRML